MSSSSFSINNPVVPGGTVSLGLGAEAAVYRRRQEAATLYSRRPVGVKKGAWVEVIAKKMGTSPATVRRLLKAAETGAKVPERKKRELSSWSPEAVHYLQAFFLAAVKEAGSCSKKRAIEALKTEAAAKGWRIGCDTSAYKLLDEIDPLLVKYAKGGDRELDNFFYVARDLTTLSPMQIVVGDQHIFDYWVEDKETGKVFRPECYLWLDMRTRMVYGLAFAKPGKGYNSETVRQSLRIGLKRFGKFGRTYNDNGRPELAQAVTAIINELAAYGMEIGSEADLYRTASGAFAVEDETGKVVGTAKTRREWEQHRNRIFARVKNAKAKPIERFFSTLEKLLEDRLMPGKVKPLAASAPVEEENQNRLDRQRKSGQLLSPEEFQLVVLQCIDTYENRTHGAFNHSPKEELMQLVAEGWKPTFINQKEVDFIFFNRERRKVRAGRVRVDGSDFEGEPIAVNGGRIDPEIGITSYEGKEIEVRWNPEDPEECYAVCPDGSIRPLRKVIGIDPTDESQVSAALEWKRQQKKAVRQAFAVLTQSVSGTVLTTTTAPKIEQAQNRKKTLPPPMTGAELKAAAEKKAVEYKAFAIQSTAAKTHKTPLDRYKWCIDRLISGCELNSLDSGFVAKFEQSLTASQRQYWTTYKKIGGLII